MQAPLYGFSASVRFGASVATSAEKQAVDIMANDAVPMWRISAFSNSNDKQLLGRLIYGTTSSIELANLICPIVAYVPGNVQLYLRPSANPFLPAECIGHVSVRNVTNAGAQILRTLNNAAGGVVDLGVSAVRFIALQNSTVSVAGFGVALLEGQSVELVGPARLLVGAGIAEHEL